MSEEKQGRSVEVPVDLLAEIELAERERRAGDLALLADETMRFGQGWAEVGLRHIGEAQSRIAALGKAHDTPENEDPARVLVFTGHRVDAPDRTRKRFPLAAEGRARELIFDAVAKEIAGVGGRVLAYAGGASGGDILFHQVCDELGVESHLRLAGPRDKYVAASVEDSEGDWVKRFDAVHEKRAARTRVLTPDLLLPRWLREAPYSIWQRNNLWELLTAMAHGEAKTTLIALWDGKEGDGAGGTKDMVERARKRGARVVILDARELASSV